ncbi:FISUMP domain-containing protein [Elizabethkingia sp. HX XZB]|uniref:FISUMP domain-containing protein n=1 Tax=Elizabethkingia sp. HX XZB TaxID=3003193 RepID=UPI002A249ED8|nr:FISUMP domain-containing protein [Elizabethkingia sp. HX XZB]MDX8568492.1 FISUMP domain-containing protein [Elizabethkingia sp. HX XZB]
MMKNKIFELKNLVIAVFLLVMQFSCRGTDSGGNLSEGKAIVKIKIEGETFEDAKDIGSQALLGKNQSLGTDLVQRQEIMLNQEFNLVAELSAVTSTTTNYAQATSNGIMQADIKRLSGGVRYKLLVYKSTGEYVTERNYIYGQEGSTAALNLEGDGNYIFIVYSVNSDKDLPEVSFSTPTSKMLSGSTLTGLSSTADFMYYRKDMQVSGNKPNYLDVTLKHKLSQITVTIDASATGYNITGVTAGFDSHYPSYNVNLSGGELNRVGSVGSIPVSFPSTSGTNIITGTPTLINGETTTGKFTISSITIGSLTQSVPREAMTGLRITSGIKYNLKLRINPSDIYLDHNGQKAARINGLIWMRHNLGADTKIDPDKEAITSGLHGNYYQFGRILSEANATATNVNSNYNRIAAASNAWNSGTEAAPKKTGNDPCPSGYRVPASAEVRVLINATTESIIGNWRDSPVNYSAAKVFTSKRNNAIRLTMPTQGYFSFNDPLRQRGTASLYWTSSINSANIGFSNFFNVSANPVTISGWYNQQGFPIRCIAE